MSTQHIKARWAFSELTSTRFGPLLRKMLPGHLVDHAKRGRPFELLSEKDRARLVLALNRARPPSFVGLLDRYGGPQYQLGYWTVAELLNCLTLPQWGSPGYYRWLAMPGSGTAKAGQRNIDPRIAAAQIPLDLDFRVQHPLIAVCVDDRHMLVDGYLRSILWLRTTPHPLPVLLPVSRMSKPNEVNPQEPRAIPLPRSSSGLDRGDGVRSRQKASGRRPHALSTRIEQ